MVKNNGDNMQNTLFDNLKDLKKDMAANEKQENVKKEEELKRVKEDNLKVDFEVFMKNSGIKKIK